ncbi:MAG: 30S ribosomal protein S9 [Candidatus Pacebacteria bacterium]|nr:30S ribosomal protein S9 [Candidatus Paceibacterota bacterium]
MATETKTKKVAEKKEAKVKETKEEIKFSGKYIRAVGRRKTAVAQVRLYLKGKGQTLVNDKKIKDFFQLENHNIALQPLKELGVSKDFDLSVLVKGGGIKAQAEAIRHGVSRALLINDEKLRETLKIHGWLTRDARKKERKKPGLKKARKRPQWSKR